MTGSHENVHPRCWTWRRLLFYAVLLGAVYIVSQVGAAIVLLFATVSLSGVTAIDVTSEQVSSFLSRFLPVTVLASAAACVPLVLYLAGRCEARPGEFLGLRRSSVRYIAVACGITVVFVAAGDIVTSLLGRSVIPAFMVEAFEGSTPHRIMLFAALVLAAPVCEELLFRGFLFGGLRACGATVGVSVLVVSILFSVLHFQYDAYDGTIVFLMGLLYAGARVQSGSVVPGMAMHGLTNAIAYVETAILL